MKPSTESTYPVSLNLRGKSVLLVGGGEVAFRKARGLSGTGCRLTVVARAFSPDFQTWLEQSPFHREQRAYREGESAGYFLIISATDDPAVNRRIFDDADSAGRLINVVDQPGLCTIYIPSRIKRGSLQVAISTDGKCPGFAGWLRPRLEETVPERYGLLLDHIARIRTYMKETIPSQDARKRILTRILHSKATRRFLEGNDQFLTRMERGWKRADPKPK